MAEFLPVVTVSNWGYFDHLDGRELQDGELVEVKWPDDTVETHIAHVTQKCIWEEHGDTRIFDSSARLEVMYRGVWVHVPLRDSGLLLRRDVPQDRPTGNLPQ